MKITNPTQTATMSHAASMMRYSSRINRTSELPNEVAGEDG